MDITVSMKENCSNNLLKVLCEDSLSYPFYKKNRLVFSALSDENTNLVILEFHSSATVLLCCVDEIFNFKRFFWCS